MGYVKAAVVSGKGPYRDLLLPFPPSPDWNGNVMAARSLNRDNLGKEDGRSREGRRSLGLWYRLESLMPTMDQTTSGLLPEEKINPCFVCFEVFCS